MSTTRVGWRCRKILTAIERFLMANLGMLTGGSTVPLENPREMYSPMDGSCAGFEAVVVGV